LSVLPILTQRHHIDTFINPFFQPCDAKIPFSLPWWDNIERRIAAFFGFPKDKNANQLQPYLSTLCVDEKYRGKQIGRAMVRCLEDIAANKWGFSKIYLHVDGDNAAAMKLYKTEGYQDVGCRWNPFWAGKAADIGYFVKNLMRP
jgi:RimJ/RimL family protein N-acetyltransferase